MYNQKLVQYTKLTKQIIFTFKTDFYLMIVSQCWHFLEYSLQVESASRYFCTPYLSNVKICAARKLQQPSVSAEVCQKVGRKIDWLKIYLSYKLFIHK